MSKKRLSQLQSVKRSLKEINEELAFIEEIEKRIEGDEKE